MNKRFFLFFFSITLASFACWSLFREYPNEPLTHEYCCNGNCRFFNSTDGSCSYQYFIEDGTELRSPITYDPVSSVLQLASILFFPFLVISCTLCTAVVRGVQGMDRLSMIILAEFIICGLFLILALGIRSKPNDSWKEDYVVNTTIAGVVGARIAVMAGSITLMIKA